MSGNKNLDAYLKLRNSKYSKKLGSGAVGTVYLCHTQKKEARAIKMIRLNEQNRPLFERERDLMTAVGLHPYIMRFYFSAVLSEHGYLEYEYVKGITVDELMDIYMKTNSLFFIKIAQTLLSGLEHLHSLGIFHRDISSLNTMICLDPDDADMPFYAKIIDLGIGCMIDNDETASCPDGRGIGPQATSLYTWPYASAEGSARKTLMCTDIWLAGSTLYQIAYGINFNFFDTFAKGLIFQGYYLPEMGGHPVPPDLSVSDDRKEYLDPDPSILGTLDPDSLKVAKMYRSYVLGKERDPIYDFTATYESIIHDILRLMLSRDINKCFSATDLLRYIDQEWDIPHYGHFPQRRKLNNCELPCEDPHNNFYKHNCNACEHCEWDAVGSKRGQHTVHCRPIPPNDKTEDIRAECLARVGKHEYYIWNPYRKDCDMISDENEDYLSKRYSILFKDGGHEFLPGEEIRRRIKDKDFRELDTDLRILSRLEDYPYHPLTTTPSDTPFHRFYNDPTQQVPPKPIPNLNKVTDLSQLRQDEAMLKQYCIQFRKSLRRTRTKTD